MSRRALSSLWASPMALGLAAALNLGAGAALAQPQTEPAPDLAEPGVVEDTNATEHSAPRDSAAGRERAAQAPSAQAPSAQEPPPQVAADEEPTGQATVAEEPTAQESDAQGPDAQAAAADEPTGDVSADDDSGRTAESATANPAAAGEEQPSDAPDEAEQNREPIGDQDTGGPEAAPEPEEESDEESEEALSPEHQPTLERVLSPESGLRTGELLEVTISATVPEGDDLSFPEQELGEFELFEQAFREVPIEGGGRRLSFVLQLLVLQPGELTLPALSLRVVTADGQVGRVQTEPMTIRVNSHLANEPDAEPRPPTEPVTVMEEDYTLAWVLGALGALLLMALLGFLFARYLSRRPKAAIAPPPPRPPWEVALERLRELRKRRSRDVQAGQAAQWVDQTSDALREYLGRRYDFNGLESTTDEVLARLSKQPNLGFSVDEVRALLADSDLVKFARAVPDDEQCERMLEGSLRIVRASTPRNQPDRARGASASVPRAPADRIDSVPGKARATAPPRIQNDDGGITLPLSCTSMEEAQEEVRRVVLATIRDKVDDTGFNGTIRVVLSPELKTGPETDEALAQLHRRIQGELSRVEIASVRPVKLIVEHYHERRWKAAKEGRPPRSSVFGAEQTPSSVASDASQDIMQEAGEERLSEPAPDRSTAELSEEADTAAWTSPPSQSIRSRSATLQGNAFSGAKPAAGDEHADPDDPTQTLVDPPNKSIDAPGPEDLP